MLRRTKRSKNKVVEPKEEKEEEEEEEEEKFQSRIVQLQYIIFIVARILWGRKISTYRRALRSRNVGCFISDKTGGIFG